MCHNRSGTKQGGVRVRGGMGGVVGWVGWGGEQGLCNLVKHVIKRYRVHVDAR